VKSTIQIGPFVLPFTLLLVPGSVVLGMFVGERAGRKALTQRLAAVDVRSVGHSPQSRSNP